MSILAQPLSADPTIKPTVTLAGIGTAVPALRVSQQDVLDFILKNFELSSGARELYRRAMRGTAIATRHFALTSLVDCLDVDPDRVIERFERSAVELSAQSLARALASTSAPAGSIDFLAAATCTGYLCPGLSAQILERSDLRSDVRLSDVVGMGCGAAIPALEQATNFVRSNPGSTAAVVCTEICSAALFSSDEPGIIISNAIFADGSAAVILKSGSNGVPANRLGMPRLSAFASETRPEWRESLRFRTEGGRLKNILDRHVPEQAGEALAVAIGRLLASNEIPRTDVDRWILHAGGSKVLDEAERALGLNADDTLTARDVLKNFGNMSSPTVLFVLASAMKHAPPPGSRAVMASFGAGFSAHAALLEF